MLGRGPIDDQEATEWIQSLVAEANARQARAIGAIIVVCAMGVGTAVICGLLGFPTTAALGILLSLTAPIVWREYGLAWTELQKGVVSRLCIDSNPEDIPRLLRLAGSKHRNLRILARAAIPRLLDTVPAETLRTLDEGSIRIMKRDLDRAVHGFAGLEDADAIYLISAIHALIRAHDLPSSGSMYDLAFQVPRTERQADLAAAARHACEEIHAAKTAAELQASLVLPAAAPQSERNDLLRAHGEPQLNSSRDLLRAAIDSADDRGIA
ncbi:MAG TPA: hypothetical protein VGS41_16540 [Chthonomonadales bacterium]|nr:hypothetical protein [Chthonomonadales bacterium]